MKCRNEICDFQISGKCSYFEKRINNTIDLNKITVCKRIANYELKNFKIRLKVLKEVIK